MAVFDRIASVLFAVLLLAVGVLVPIEVVHTLLGNTGHLLVPYESITRLATSHVWRDSSVLAVCAATGVVGLVIVAFELRRRRPALLTVVPLTDGVVSGMSRRSLRRAVSGRAQDVDGVTLARAAVRRRTVVVTATSTLREPGDLEQRLTTQVSDWLDGLGLVRPLRLRTRLRTKEG